MQNLFLGLEKNGSKLIDFKFENKLNKTIIGVDEVGRGPWAGPVIAVACLFIDNKSNGTLDAALKVREFWSKGNQFLGRYQKPLLPTGDLQRIYISETKKMAKSLGLT